MKKTTTSDRLKYIISQTGLRQVDILQKCKPYCEQYGVRLGRNDLSQYVSGKVEPRQDKLSILGLALDVSEAWLMGYDVPMDRDDKQEYFTYDNLYPVEIRQYPLLGEIACGKPIFAAEDKDTYILANSEIKADFCLKCKGDSMVNARIYDGDIVFVRKQEIVENGEIAAVIIDEEVTLKRVYYYPDKNKIVLNAENPSYEPFVYSDEELNSVRILGKAVAFQSEIK